MESIGRCNPVSYSYKDLELFTNAFSKTNFLGDTQYGKLYRGKISGGSNQSEYKLVTVKIWVNHGEANSGPMYDKQRLDDELCFLQHPSMNNHPNLVRLIGYCEEDKRFGAVYDLHPVDTLENLIEKSSLGWIQRIKVAIGFARLLDFLHRYKPPYQVCNIAAAHIMIDQDMNPRLLDFSMLSGGILGDRPNLPGRIVMGAFGYMDRQYALSGLDCPGKRDVFAFGVLLLNLIAKKSVNEYPRNFWLDDWARSEFKRKGVLNLVHDSLKSESGYEDKVGYAITMLAMRCFYFVQKSRPTMRQIARFLQDILVSGSKTGVVFIEPLPDDARLVGSLPETT